MIVNYPFTNGRRYGGRVPGRQANVTIAHDLPPISAPLANHDEEVPTSVQKYAKNPKR